MNLIATLGTVAIFAAAPASIGLIGDATFSADVPVRIPSRAILLDSDGNPTDGPSARIGRRGDDDDGGNRPRDRRTEPGDDHDGNGPRSGRTEAGDDHDGGGTEAGDDHGGQGSGVDGAGDERGGQGSGGGGTGAVDDHGGQGSAARRGR